MSEEKPSYQKIPGRGLGFGGWGRVWLGNDHLLEVVSNTFMERYRRYFFRDVRALMIQRTSVRTVWAWIQGSIGGIATILAAVGVWSASRSAEEELRIGVYILSGLAGVVGIVGLTMLVINLLLGPSCRCQVLTAAGWHALAAPMRLGPARQLQERIVPLIATAQAEGSREPAASVSGGAM